MELLGVFIGFDRDTDILIREILLWAPIIDLNNVLPVNSYFSNHAKQSEQWEHLQAIVPILPLHTCESCRQDLSEHDEECEDRLSFYKDYPRILKSFKSLCSYDQCRKLMPSAQSYVRNLLLCFDLKHYLNNFEGFSS
jgi:hypothetical protein